MDEQRRYWCEAEATLRRLSESPLCAQEMAVLGSQLNSPSIIEDIDKLVSLLLQLRELGAKLHGIRTGLPPIGHPEIHTPELIAELQKPALRLYDDE